MEASLANRPWPPAVTWAVMFAALLVAYVPSFVDLFQTLWATDQNAHGPIVLAV